jgi:tryptophanyl-tRNA synthetase
MARLTHLPQYKDKSSKFKEVPLGLYLYPILQSADIMLHKAHYVPVGEDQIQHIQLAQHLTKNFNNRFGSTFPTCQPIIADDSSCRIKSLRDPSKKMSKSDVDKKSFLNLTDSSDAIREKLKKAVTDFTSAVTFDVETRPGVANLIMMHSLVSGKTPQQICEEVTHLDTGKYKDVVADVLISHFDPIRKKIEEYSNDKSYIQSVLAEGNDKAREFAAQTIKEVKGKVGLGNF